jgi:glycosyltransferase involved in cell wall biosynthesis
MIKLTIITASLNSLSTLRVTTESIECNKRFIYEYIVIDGGSTDGSLEYLQDKFAHNCINQLLRSSRPGIYTSLNEALKHATGDYVGILHAGSYINRESFINLHSRLDSHLKIGSFPILASSAEWHIDNHVRQESRSKLRAISCRNTKLLHETLFIPMKLYASCNLYNEEYTICSDLDFVYKSLAYYEAQIIYSDQIKIIFTQPWGLSERKKLIKLKEQITIINNYNSRVFLFYFAFTRIIKYFTKKLLFKIR